MIYFFLRLKTLFMRIFINFDLQLFYDQNNSIYKLILTFYPIFLNFRHFHLECRYN